MNQDVRTAWRVLRAAFVIAPLVAGIDKFFHLLVNWDMYLSPLAQRILGNLSHPFMLLVGVIEICVGLLMLTRWTEFAGYIASAWLLLIAINLVMCGQYYDIALRDVGLCLCAFAYGRLTAAMAVAGHRTRTAEERLAA
jgi:hypothetical protein